MTPRERVLRRLAGEPVDRPPNLCILMAFAARQVGVTYDRYCQDFRHLVEANLLCCERFGIDLPSAISDPMRECADFGAPVAFPHDRVPELPEPFVRTASDLAKLRRFDPLAPGRMQDRVRAVEAYRREAGDTYAILGWVEGPIAEAADLHGVGETLTDLYVEPELVRALMTICREQAIRCAEAQVQAGADLIGVGDAVASLIPPELYEAYVFPEQRALFEGIHRLGAKVKLHICGNTTHLLPKLAETGADMIDLDWPVDFAEAHRTVAGRAALCGNFDPVAVVLQGTPETVHAAVRRCLAAGDARTFIAAGCEIPRETPPENLRAVAEALREADARPPELRISKLMPA